MQIKNYKISIPIQSRYSGFNWSIDYYSNDGMIAGVLCGLLKRHSFYCDDKRLNLGYIFINIQGILNLFR